MLRRLGLSLLLATALGSSAWAQDSSRFDGRYSGELILTRTIDGDCTEPPRGALYPLTVSGGEVRFAYLPRFATILTGKVAKDGSFKALARIKHGVVQMTGRIQGNKVTARLVSPSCRYTFQTTN